MQPYKSPWWLKGPHLQTLWGALVRSKPYMKLEWERLELSDGDFLDLAWTVKTKSDPIPLPTSVTCVTPVSPHTPIVLILHGLNGSIDSSYAAGMLLAIKKLGWRGVIMHFRGCSGKPNRLPRAYHSGETGDLQTVVTELKTREPNTPLFAVGYSLGGNVLLKWLGETGATNPLQATAAVSVPFELDKTADYLNTGFSKLYQWWLIRGLKIEHHRKFKNHPLKAQFETHPFRKDHFKNVNKIKNFWEFDDQITAPLHGFKNAKEYYELSSCRQFLKDIEIPTLILHAKNDPFVPTIALPTVNEVSTSVTLEISEEGGHVGFISGKFFWQPEYWLEQRILNYFAEQTVTF